MLKRSLQILLLAILIFSPLTNTLAQDPPSLGQRIAYYAKPAVVRIYNTYKANFQINSSSITFTTGDFGSGFFINSNGYIATNAHVVQYIQNEESLVQRLKQFGIQNIVNSNRLSQAEKVYALNNLRLVSYSKSAQVILPNGTALPYDIKAYGAPVGEGKDCAIIKIEVKNAPTLRIGDSERVQLQDHMYVIGYPGIADLNGLLDEKSALEASITDGRVSARKNTADGSPVLQVTAAISNGNSGGAAINDAGEVIGLPTFGKSATENFNFLVTSTTLNEFVRQVGVDNNASLTDKYYREGLELYWDRRYTAAIDKFQEVDSLFKYHSETKNLIAQAREFKRQGKERSNYTVVLIVFVVGGVFLLVLVGGSVAALVYFRKKQAAAVLAGAGGSDNVLPKADLATSPFNNRATADMSPTNQAVPRTIPQSAVSPSPSTAPTYDQAAKTLVANSPSKPLPDTTIPITAMKFGTLKCTRGLLMGQAFTIPAQGIYIGRAPGAGQITIPDGRASSKHVWIGIQNGRMMAIDQGSTNGTFINALQNGRINQIELREGDTIIVAEPDVCSFSFTKN